MSILKFKATLDSMPFARGMDKMRGEVSSFDDKLKTIKMNMGALFSAGIASQFVKSALDTADAIDNMAKQSGLGIEAFQALKAAGDEAGVAFETMRPPINALRRAIDKARDGSEQQVKAFEALGVSMSDLNKLKTEQVLARVGKAMNESTEGSEAMVASTVVLGAESTRLQEIFKELGDSGIEGLIDKYKELGMVIETSTVKALDAAEEAASRAGESIKNEVVGRLGMLVGQLQLAGAMLGATTPGQGRQQYFKELGIIEEDGSLLTKEERMQNEAKREALRLQQEMLDAQKRRMKLFDEESVYLEAEQKYYLETLSDAERLIELQKMLTEAKKKHDESFGNDYLVAADSLNKMIRYEKQIASLKEKQAAAEAKIRDEAWKAKLKEIEQQEYLIDKIKEYYGIAKDFGSTLKDSFFGGGKDASEEETKYSSLRRIGGNLAGGGAKGESRQEKLIRQNEEFIKQQKKAVEILQNIEAQKGAVL